MVVCGLDEAGRGSLAGPLVAAAVILKEELKERIEKRKFKIKDGKLLNSRQRDLIYRKLRGKIVVESISARRINNHGIGWANREIFKRLMKKLPADQYIIDGNLKIRGAESVVDADATIPEVICAGIVAKVERDNIMCGLHKEFKHYHWKINKGYGTKKHIEAIRKYGSCCYHRSVFVTTALRKETLPPPR